jgi:hypothetical protein
VQGVGLLKVSNILYSVLSFAVIFVLIYFLALQYIPSKRKVKSIYYAYTLEEQDINIKYAKYNKKNGETVYCSIVMSDVSGDMDIICDKDKKVFKTLLTDAVIKGLGD